MLSPWRPPGASTTRALGVDPDRVVHTVGRLEDLDALAAQGRASGRPVRVVLERLTSMLRHGFSGDDLAEAVRRSRAGGVRVEGVALHLPLPSARATTSGAPPTSPRCERLLAEPAVAELARGGGPARQVWVSHLTEAELEVLALRFPDLVLRPRVGTGLWLGDRGALRGHRHGARRPPGGARRHLRLPRPVGAPARHRCWWSRAAPPTASAWRPPPATPRCAPGRPRWPAAASTPPGSCARRTASAASSGSSPSRRTCRSRCSSSPTAPRCPAVGEEIEVPGALHRDVVRPGRDLLTAARPGRHVHRVGAHRVVGGAQHVAHHDGDQVELGGQPQPDREVVER